MKKIILGVLLICSLNVLAASSNRMAIGYNPADFTIVGTDLPGAALTDPVVTGLHKARCPKGSGSSYTMVASEDPRVKEAIENEIELSSSEYADPTFRLNPNIIEASHLVKGW